MGMPSDLDVVSRKRTRLFKIRLQNNGFSELILKHECLFSIDFYAQHIYVGQKGSSSLPTLNISSVTTITFRCSAQSTPMRWDAVQLVECFFLGCAFPTFPAFTSGRIPLPSSKFNCKCCIRHFLSRA